MHEYEDCVMHAEQLSQVPLMISGVPIALMNALECRHANQDSRRVRLLQSRTNDCTSTNMHKPSQT